LKRILAYALLLSVTATALLAQDEAEPGGMLVTFLQDTLSGESSQVKVTGLSGAFSSRATIEKITVSDDEGIWLTITDAVLDWNRLALLRGRFSVNALSAGQIILSRMPGQTTPADTSLPSAETRPFSLPELPVSIEIGEISIDRLSLGKPVLGVAGELDLKGTLVLADGALDTSLAVSRLDRPGDGLDLIARFDNQSRIIILDLRLVEDAGGMLSAALGLPGRPSVRLSAKGKGPVEDFAADIELDSDGARRLAGRVALQSVAAPGPDDKTPPPIAFSANLAGDISPLLAPDYRAFFGRDTRLELSGQSYGDGRLEIARFQVASDALALNGALDIAAGGALERVMLQGWITPADGARVVLPVTGPLTTVQGARISANFDMKAANTWDITMVLDGLERPDLRLTQARFQAIGTLDQADGLKARGKVAAALTGLDFGDAALSRALGARIALKGQFGLNGTGALRLSQFSLTGDGYNAVIDGEIDGLDSGFQMSGSARIDATDLSRFDGLAGYPIGGALRARIKGSGVPLTGSFDIELTGEADDLRSGIAAIDPLVGGKTRLTLSARRNENGLNIRDFRLDGDALQARASGILRRRDSALTLSAGLDDLARITPTLSGPLQISGEVAQGDGAWRGQVRLKGPIASFADLDGTMQENGDASLTFDAALTRIERFVPELSGTITASGTAARTGRNWQIASTASGPAGISATVDGSLDQVTGKADIGAKGQLQLGIVNRLISPNSLRGIARFDLTLKGDPSLEAISGTITTTGATVAVPQLGRSLRDLGARVSLSGGRASLSLNGAVSSGGRFSLSGPVGLRAPFPATLTMQLEQIVLSDNLSYDSSAGGQLVYAGPLTGNGALTGEIVFGKTEINIASASGSLAAAPIPDIRHLAEPGPVRATRQRAGLIRTEKSGSVPIIALDINLVARNKVFVRGRGLQAELGGAVRIGGTTARVVPSGQIDLLRGGLDIFGRRIRLTKGLVTLQGQLEPYIEFAATTTTSDGTATLDIAGPLTAPRVEVTSSPPRPSEEALAMLIFGNQYSELSPLKLAQIAVSLAQISGAGGGGGAKGKLRKGLGVDTLDIGTDKDGNGQIGAGTYISDNIYTDVTVNTRGETELNLNLDMTESVTVKGLVDSTGNTALGLFFERDY
jgi:translocation and assembly module TamB